MRILPGWLASKATYEQFLAFEYKDAANVYWKTFVEYVQRVGSGDLLGLLDAPISSMVVESMLSSFGADVEHEERIRAVLDFFGSDHFRGVPYEWLSTRACAVLKDRVRRGQPTNLKKAAEKISHTFQDIEHVATYGPYCDAIFIDKAMADLVRDSRIGLEKRYDVKVFCEENWSDFDAWLNTLDANLSPEHAAGLAAAYPTSIANPFDVTRGA